MSSEHSKSFWYSKVVRRTKPVDEANNDDVDQSEGSGDESTPRSDASEDHEVDADESEDDSFKAILLSLSRANHSLWNDPGKVRAVMEAMSGKEEDLVTLLRKVLTEEEKLRLLDHNEVKKIKEEEPDSYSAMEAFMLKAESESRPPSRSILEDVDWTGNDVASCPPRPRSSASSGSSEAWPLSQSLIDMEEEEDASEPETQLDPTLGHGTDGGEMFPPSPKTVLRSVGNIPSFDPIHQTPKRSSGEQKQDSKARRKRKGSVPQEEAAENSAKAIKRRLFSATESDGDQDNKEEELPEVGSEGELPDLEEEEEGGVGIEDPIEPEVLIEIPDDGANTLPKRRKSDSFCNRALLIEILRWQLADDAEALSDEQVLERFLVSGVLMESGGEGGPRCAEAAVASLLPRDVGRGQPVGVGRLCLLHFAKMATGPQSRLAALISRSQTGVPLTLVCRNSHDELIFSTTQSLAKCSKTLKDVAASLTELQAHYQLPARVRDNRLHLTFQHGQDELRLVPRGIYTCYWKVLRCSDISNLGKIKLVFCLTDIKSKEPIEKERGRQTFIGEYFGV